MRILKWIFLNQVQDTDIAFIMDEVLRKHVHGIIIFLRFRLLDLFRRLDMIFL